MSRGRLSRLALLPRCQGWGIGVDSVCARDPWRGVFIVGHIARERDGDLVVEGAVGWCWQGLGENVGSVVVGLDVSRRQSAFANRLDDVVMP